MKEQTLEEKVNKVCEYLKGKVGYVNELKHVVDMLGGVKMSKESQDFMLEEITSVEEQLNNIVQYVIGGK